MCVCVCVCVCYRETETRASPDAAMLLALFNEGFERNFLSHRFKLNENKHLSNLIKSLSNKHA